MEVGEHYVERSRLENVGGLRCGVQNAAWQAGEILGISNRHGSQGSHHFPPKGWNPSRSEKAND